MPNKLTREQALELHRQMWTDMQNALGDTPNGGKRVFFKENWCEEHFPDDAIDSNCFLCEYVAQNDYSEYGRGCNGGRDCLLVWPYGDCTMHSYYYDAPISEILALPEREV